MRVGIGTVDIDDATLKAINKSQGKPGRAKRVEAKAWVEQKIAEAAERVKNGEDTVFSAPVEDDSALDFE